MTFVSRCLLIFASMEFAQGKRYNSFTGYFKRVYGERLQKVVIDAGFTCPNRDGSLGGVPIMGCMNFDLVAERLKNSDRDVSEKD